MIKLVKIPASRMDEFLGIIRNLEDSGKEVRVGDDYIEVGGIGIRIVSKTEEMYLLHIKSADSLRNEFESLMAEVSKCSED